MMATLLLLLQPIQLQLVGFLLGIGERVLEMVSFLSQLIFNQKKKKKKEAFFHN